MMFQNKKRYLPEVTFHSSNNGVASSMEFLCTQYICAFPPNHGRVRMDDAIHGVKGHTGHCVMKCRIIQVSKRPKS